MQSVLGIKTKTAMNEFIELIENIQNNRFKKE
jgi:hypothetical protein